jgi:hypothetical protein
MILVNVHVHPGQKHVLRSGNMFDLVPKSWCDGGNILLIQPKKKTRSILQRFGRQGRDKYMFILLRRHAYLVRKLMFDLVQIQSAGVENSYLLITKCRGSGFQL